MTWGDALIALGWGMGIASVFVSAAPLLAFGLPGNRFELLPSKLSVQLRGRDPEAMLMAGLPVAFLVGLAIAWTTAAGLATAGATAVLWTSFRLSVEIGPGRTRIRRLVAWVIPWRTRTYSQSARAVIDGWGDWMDPETLCLTCGEGTASLVLAWGDARFPSRLEELAEELNAAVRSLEDGAG